jgi:hypothetical protein
VSSPYRYRRYRVEFGQAFPTTLDTNGPPPKVGDMIRTPIGRLIVLEIAEPDRVGRRGQVRAERR